MNCFCKATVKELIKDNISELDGEALEEVELDSVEIGVITPEIKAEIGIPPFPLPNEQNPLKGTQKNTKTFIPFPFPVVA